MDSDRLKQKIRESAAEIARLHSRIHETLAHRGKNPERRREWERACAEFHAEQAVRLKVIEEKLADWRQRKLSKKDRDKYG